jgi:hypothetical protein
MSRLLAISCLLLGLLVLTSPANAAYQDCGGQAVAIGTAGTALDFTSASPDAGCDHVPCPNPAHQHSPSGCHAHSFLMVSPLEALIAAETESRVAIADEAATGRTLMPPVPPPL